MLVAAALTVSPASASVTRPPAAEPQKLVILGASYAASWGTPPLPSLKVVNKGVGGEQTGGMRARFQRDVVAERPAIVLIWGHINNITQSDLLNLTPAGIESVKAGARADYRAMLEQARAAGIEVVLATEIPMAEAVSAVDHLRALLGRLRGKQSYASQVNAQVRDLNVFVRELAAREQLQLLDFERVFAPDGGARKPEYSSEDRSHVSTAGYRALTDYAAAELRKRR